jgi:hypothetical protein
MTSLLSDAPALLVSLVDGVPKPEDVTPGWIYALVIIGLIAVTIVLWLSMRKQLKKINVDRSAPTTPDSPEEPPA